MVRPAFVAVALAVAGLALGSNAFPREARARAVNGPEPGGPAAALLEVRPVAYPAYEAYRGIARYAPTREDYARAIADEEFVMERLRYRSGGLEVYAYLYRPKAASPDQKRPVVIFNRGSYVRDDFAPEVLMLGNRLARLGYVVVAPMLRGSGGAAGHDEMGGADVDDLFNLLPALAELPGIDAARVFLYGESRGGIMCLLAARRGFPAKAMAVYGTISDLGLFLAEGSPARAMGPAIWPDFATREGEIVEARSAVRWADEIGIPVLILHGADDGDVPSVHALRLAQALAENAKPYELKIFHGEKHVLAGRAAERDEDAVRWFRRFDEATALGSGTATPQR